MVIETMTPEQTAQRLRELGMKVSPDKIRNGLKQGVYPFGDFVDMGKSPAFTIYTKLFNSWVAERASD